MGKDKVLGPNVTTSGAEANAQTAINGERARQAQLSEAERLAADPDAINILPLTGELTPEQKKKRDQLQKQYGGGV